METSNIKKPKIIDKDNFENLLFQQVRILFSNYVKKDLEPIDDKYFIYKCEDKYFFFISMNNSNIEKYNINKKNILFYHFKNYNKINYWKKEGIETRLLNGEIESIFRDFQNGEFESIINNFKNSYTKINKFELKNDNEIIKYKYKGIKNNINDDIQSRFLYGNLTFSHPKSLNDPFDCDIEQYYINLSYDIMIKMIKNKIRKKIFFVNTNFKQYNIFSFDNSTNKILINEENLSYFLYDNQMFNIEIDSLKSDIKNELNKIEGIEDRIRVLSLSESFDNILLWSYYGNEHKGICNGYKYSDLINGINNCNLNGLFIIGKIKYADKKPKYQYIFDKNNICFLDTLIFIINRCFTKYEGWVHEKEYRIIYLPINKEIKKFVEINFKINSMYVGCECDNILYGIVNSLKPSYIKQIKLLYKDSDNYKLL